MTNEDKKQIIACITSTAEYDDLIDYYTYDMCMSIEEAITKAISGIWYALDYVKESK